MEVKGGYGAAASLVPSLVLISVVGFGVTYYQLSKEQIGEQLYSTAWKIDFEPIEAALLTIRYTQNGVVLSPQTERALRQAVLAFPLELSQRQRDRIVWLTARINPLHGNELAALLIRYQQYQVEAEAVENQRVSGIRQLQQLIGLQQQYFGEQAANKLFPSQRALFEAISARASSLE